MKKIIMTVTTVAVVGLTSTIFSSPAHADGVNDLRNKQTEVANERAEVKAELSKAEGEIADILFDLREINEEIVKVNEALEQNEAMLKEAEEDVTKTEEEIAEIEEEIVELEDKIEARFDILKQRVTSYQKSGGSIGFLEVIFGSKSFGDFISRTSAVTKITNSDSELIKQQEEDKAEVKVKQAKVEEKLSEQKEMQVELEGMKAVILDQQEENKSSKKKLENKEKQLVALKSDLEGQESSLAALESEIRRDIIRATTPTRVVVSNSNERSSSASSDSNNNNLTTLSKKTETAVAAAPVVNSGVVNKAISAGRQYIGKTRYIWGSSSPANGGFDCSGFISWAFGQAGVSLPPSTAGLSSVGTKVPYSDIQVGDLVFFNTYKTNGHVGIYIGGGQFIGSQSSDGVSIRSIESPTWKSMFTGHVRRVR